MNFRSVVGVGAHPYDLELYAGATIGGLVKSGARVTLVICTDGAQGLNPEPGLVEKRRHEATRSAEVLGAQVVLLGRPDGQLVVDDSLRRALVWQLRRDRAELVLCHDPTTWWLETAGCTRLGQSDNRSAGQATLDAIYPRTSLRSYHPEFLEAGLYPWLVSEVWLFDTCAPDHFVDTSEHLDLKKAALTCHESQLPLRLVEEAEAEEERWQRQKGFPAEAFHRLRLV